MPCPRRAAQGNRKDVNSLVKYILSKKASVQRGERNAQSAVAEILGWRSTVEMSSMGEMTSVCPAHFNQANHTLEDLKVTVMKAGLANQEYQKKREMRLIFKYGLLVLVALIRLQLFKGRITLSVG